MFSLIKLKQAYMDNKIAKDEYISKMAEQHALCCEYSELLKDSNISEIIITKTDVIATLDSGIKLIIIPHDARVIPIEILNFGHYEEDAWKNIFDFIPKPKVIFDIGANIGYFSFFMKQHLDFTSVYAFEPIPNTFNYLQKNLSLNNKLSKGLNIYNLGLSNIQQQMNMFYNPTSCGGSSLCNITEEQQVRELMCEFSTLDIFIHENNIKELDLIKCDVEGAEKLVLEGGADTLKEFKPVIYCEMLRKWSRKFNYHPNDIINMLAPLGYKCYSIQPAGYSLIQMVTEETVETNFIFTC